MLGLHIHMRMDFLDFIYRHRIYGQCSSFQDLIDELTPVRPPGYDGVHLDP